MIGAYLPRLKGVEMQAARIVALVLAGLAVIAPAAAQPAAPVGYSVTELGTLGGPHGGFATGINDSGDVVGSSYVVDPTCPGCFIAHPFLWSHGVMHDLGTLGGDNGFASAVNNVDQVVGSSNPPGGPENHAFLYSGGTMHDLGALWSGGQTFATAINDRGDVVGYGEVSGGGLHAFLFSGGAMHDLGTLGGLSSQAWGINNRGDVVGMATTATNEWHAFLYSGGTMHDLGPWGALAINNRGDIAGRTAPFSGHPALYSHGVLHDLGILPPASNGLPEGINESDSIVGDIGDRPSLLVAFLYQNGTLYDLNTLVPPGYTDLHAADGINNRGQIVCVGDAGGEQQLLLLTPTH
jgi:probable HAF family extracellular repeat protein